MILEGEYYLRGSGDRDCALPAAESGHRFRLLFFIFILKFYYRYPRNFGGVFYRNNSKFRCRECNVDHIVTSYLTIVLIMKLVRQGKCEPTIGVSSSRGKEEISSRCVSGCTGLGRVGIVRLGMTACSKVYEER